MCVFECICWEARSSLRHTWGLVYEHVLCVRSCEILKWFWWFWNEMISFVVPTRQAAVLGVYVCARLCCRTTTSQWADWYVPPHPHPPGTFSALVLQFLIVSHHWASGGKCFIVPNDRIKTHNDDSLSWFPLSLWCSLNAPTMLWVFPSPGRQESSAAELQIAYILCWRLHIMQLL